MGGLAIGDSRWEFGDRRQWGSQRLAVRVQRSRFVVRRFAEDRVSFDSAPDRVLHQTEGLQFQTQDADR